MHGYVDLHCHWVAGIDDGAKTVADSIALLRELRSCGFDRVVATPHMRPGLFDNTKSDLLEAFERTKRAFAGADALPGVHLASEHFFDDIVFQRLISGEGLPYPGHHAVLIEFSYTRFPAMAERRFADLTRKGLRPVLAHPERYEPVWKEVSVLDGLLDMGALLLMDVAALVGKYGQKAKRAAEVLLDGGYYYAACSDAHAVRDVEAVANGIDKLVQRAGREEASFMLAGGPQSILEGRFED